jgi:hypothetical protein
MKMFAYLAMQKKTGNSLTLTKSVLFNHKKYPRRKK